MVGLESKHRSLASDHMFLNHHSIVKAEERNKCVGKAFITPEQTKTNTEGEDQR